MAIAQAETRNAGGGGRPVAQTFVGIGGSPKSNPNRTTQPTAGLTNPCTDKSPLLPYFYSALVPTSEVKGLLSGSVVVSKFTVQDASVTVVVC